MPTYDRLSAFRMSISDVIRQIRRNSSELTLLSADEMRAESLKLKYLAMSGEKTSSLIPKGFALVSESVRRVLGFEYYSVQLECGIHLASGKICEMKTGEGKTITAALPAFIKGLCGRGMHVATSNDYLAERDHAQLKPIYDFLGLSSAVVISSSTPESRKAAYRKDITYGTAKEFGFDYLRDRLKQIDKTGRMISRPVDPTMRPLDSALVDEADSILIDEARTPLIIGIHDQYEVAIAADCYRWAALNCGDFTEDMDFEYDDKRKKVQLTQNGKNRVRSLPQSNGTRQISIRELYEYAENAIKVRRDFQLDKHYAVTDEGVVIIDEFTGRPAEGRQWQGGIHQSVEAKEGIEISPATRSAASITLQSFFLSYRDLSGMTGTAYTSKSEFKKVYKRRVVQIPTHRPTQRKKETVGVYGNLHEKFAAVVEEIKSVLEEKRAVLIGTRSVEKSEFLSKLLQEQDIRHNVLNAMHLENEARIVAAAGQIGTVTVATNMAGRGTDIKLDDEVRANGGLHVILTEIHESQRIDFQLIGRASRQGDPGSYRVFVSMDDEILKSGFGEKKAWKFSQKYADTNGQLSRGLYAYFLNAQRKTERRHLVDRLMLLRMEKDKHERMFETGQDPYLSSVD